MRWREPGTTALGQLCTHYKSEPGLWRNYWPHAPVPATSFLDANTRLSGRGHDDRCNRRNRYRWTPWNPGNLPVRRGRML